MSSIARAILLCGLILAWVPSATACIISTGSGDGADTFTSHAYNYALHGWFIGNQAVEADPNAGQWIKTLLNPTRAGSHLYLVELLKVGGTAAWTDWHETINTAGWDWKWGNLYTMSNAPNLNSLPAGSIGLLGGPGSPVIGQISHSGDNIDFNFASIIPGSWVLIVKELVWDSTEADGLPTRRIEISENATVPIPATAWLLGAGIVGLVAIRRRQSYGQRLI